jgi:hypothetical protein
MWRASLLASMRRRQERLRGSTAALLQDSLASRADGLRPVVDDSAGLPNGSEFMRSNDDIEQANRRAKELQEHVPRVVSARYDRRTGRVVIDLSSKLIVSFAPEDAQGLENAQPSQLKVIEISPSGFGLHFQQWTPTCMFQVSSKAFRVRGRGWRRGWVRSAADRRAESRKRRPEQMADSGKTEEIAGALMGRRLFGSGGDIVRS